MRPRHTSATASLLLGASLFLWPFGSSGGPVPRPEYEVKAGFLPLFAHFVTWPPAAFADVKAPLVVGVLGDDLFGGALEKAVEREGTAGDRQVVLRRFRKVEDAKGSHVLFISKSEEGRIDRILAELGSASILTVSEIEGFAERGGIVNFFLEGNKVRFEINPDAARRAGLRISSQVLRLARIVVSARGQTLE